MLIYFAMHAHADADDYEARFSAAFVFAIAYV